MRVYSMTIHNPVDHRKSSWFVLGRWWNIKSADTLDKLMNMLTRRTRLDKKGRILCIGRPSYDITSQKRLFVVKLGHDGILWSNIYPLGQTVKIRLSPNKTRT